MLAINIRSHLYVVCKHSHMLNLHNANVSLRALLTTGNYATGGMVSERLSNSGVVKIFKTNRVLLIQIPGQSY